jgi:hypothetical protein
MRSAAGIAVVISLIGLTPRVGSGAEPYVPAPAADVPGYFAEQLPCTAYRVKENPTDPAPLTVECKGKDLSAKSLRELAILRNTIYARYGWDGFRKPWLRDYFHAQKWFKPNPHFSYKLISKVDRYNAHVFGSLEAQLTEGALRAREAELYARHGKIWNDKYQWVWKDGRKTVSCDEPDGFDGGNNPNEDDSINAWDCYYARQKWYKPNPKFSEADLTADERIELGLISRALGQFATDVAGRTKAEQSLDTLLDVGALRQLSLRDLRLLRNSIYARRGRPFKSPFIREHFRGMSWYKENPAYTDKLLTETDRRNVRLIHSVEDEAGGALGDEDWLIEPNFDGA